MSAQYKSKICKNFNDANICYYGLDCNFIHVTNGRKHIFEDNFFKMTPMFPTNHRLPIFQHICNKNLL